MLWAPLSCLCLLINEPYQVFFNFSANFMVKGRRLFWTWDEAQAKTQDEVDAWLRPYVPAGMKRLSEWVILNFDLFRVSLGKQSTFRGATTGTHWFPREMTSEKRVRNSILGTCHYPVLGSATDWLKKIFHAARPTTSTTQMWVVTRHQYGISALVSQTSFRGKQGVASPNVGCFLRLVSRVFPYLTS